MPLPEVATEMGTPFQVLGCFFLKQFWRAVFGFTALKMEGSTDFPRAPPTPPPPRLAAPSSEGRLLEVMSPH